MPWKRPPLLLIVLVSVLASAWVRPALPTSAKPATAYGQRLDYVIVVVNGEPRLVRDGEELPVVRGDLLVVREAALREAGAVPRSVRVFGVRRGASVSDDRGRQITTQELRTRDSESRKGEAFAVIATTKGVLNGAIYLRVIEPELRYAEVQVNGKARILRDGEALAVRASDQVKVAKVVTNLRSNDGVLFRIDKPVASSGKGEYEIRFTRGGEAFATIPLQVSD